MEIRGKMNKKILIGILTIQLVTVGFCVSGNTAQSCGCDQSKIISVESLPSSSVILVCFGDSATKGAVSQHYPSYIEGWIDPSSDDVVNEGKNGETSGEGLSRLIGIIDSHKYPNAKVFALWEGGNDVIDWIQEVDSWLIFDPADPDYPYRSELDNILSNMKDNLRQGIYKIQDDGAQPVLGTYYYLISYIDCPLSPLGFLLPSMTVIANHYVDEINSVVYELAAEEDVPLSDINGELGEMPYEYYYNCNHANALGNEAIAEIWYQAVIPYLFDNYPPETPAISGQTSGSAGVDYDYTFVTIDPEGEDVYYFIDWGDDQFENWIGPFDSGEEVLISHMWEEQGTYTIRAKAKDIYEGESSWETLQVSMPHNKETSNPIFFKFFERFQQLFFHLRI